MIKTKQDIYTFVGDLLRELHEGFDSLDRQDSPEDRIKTSLLAAKANYLASHFSILSKLETGSINDVKDPFGTTSNHDVELEEEVFTPSPSFEDSRADNQPVIEEISEVDDYQIEERETLIENKEESVTENLEDDKSQDSFRELSSETQDVVESSEINGEFNENNNVIDPGEGLTDIEQEESTQNDQPTSIYHHSQKSNFTEIDSVDSEELKSESNSQADIPVENSVINEVVEKPKQVFITSEKEESRLSTNQPKDKGDEVQPTRKLTLNELIQQQKKAGLTNVNQFQTSSTKPADSIIDLKTGVSLNDKLLFIKDLFNGYSLAYSEAIELLNRFDNFADADSFLQSNYSLKNNWASKPQTVDKLYEVLRKRYHQ